MSFLVMLRVFHYLLVCTIFSFTSLEELESLTKDLAAMMVRCPLRLGCTLELKLERPTQDLDVNLFLGAADHTII